LSNLHPRLKANKNTNTTKSSLVRLVSKAWFTCERPKSITPVFP